MTVDWNSPEKKLERLTLAEGWARKHFSGTGSLERDLSGVRELLSDFVDEKELQKFDELSSLARQGDTDKPMEGIAEIIKAARPHFVPGLSVHQEAWL